MRTLSLAFAALVIALGGLGRAAEEDDEKAETWAQMQRAWAAIMAYKKDHGQVPDWLSDLIPRYLPDADALLSPTEKRTGRHGDFNHVDPKVRNSFCYEFSAQKFQSKTVTKREAKEAQMLEYGAAVPILRCFLYERVLNIAYSGDAYESAVTWASSPGAQALIARIGGGPGFANGEFTAVTVVDAETREPIPDAEVRLTGRSYQSCVLPDRTLRTAQDGTVRVPLGPAQPPSRELQVTVVKPGYFSPWEKWKEGALPEEAVLGLERAATIGGVVKRSDGSPLAGARIEVATLAPGADGKNYRTPIVTETSGADGRWSCARLSKKFGSLGLTVRHPTTWMVFFRTAERPEPWKVLPADLSAGTAELRVPPASVLRGTVTDAVGKPVAGAEIFVIAKSPPPGEAAAPMKTDADGRYAQPWGEPSVVTLLVFPPAGAPGRIEFQAAGNMGAHDVSLPEGRTIRGRIVGEDGQPLSGVQVTFRAWETIAIPVSKAVAQSDVEGNFAWPNAPLESVELGLTHEGFFDRGMAVGAAAAEPRTVRMFRRTP